MMRTGPWTEGPDGRPCLGSLGVLVDDMLGYAVVRARPEDHWPTSLEIHVEFSGHMPIDGSPIYAESRAIDLSPSGGLAQGRLFDAAGRTIAIASQRLRYIPGTPSAVLSAASTAEGTAGEPARDAAPATAADFRPATTLEQLGGTLTRHDSGARLAIPVSPAVSNPNRTLHGGIMLCATEIAGHHAVQSAERPLRTGAVHISYLRPGPLEGEVVFEATTVHRGRSLAVAQVVSRNGQGKVCTFATVTSHAP
ncbi:hotdog fold thioesterase [Actinomadura sp. NBRC 104425]|uniref:PaaI family thioesterase n=1 Tax=Actinomadura sp. NBRC 104425 TaxID=3032204 RepID=UPI00332C67F5